MAMTPLRRLVVPLGIVAFIPLGPVTAQTAPRLGTSPIQDVIAAMTTEEKARLLVGMGMNVPGLMVTMDSADAAIPEKVPGAAGRTHGIPRLGIPSLTLADGPAGLRISPVRGDDSTTTYHATAFPVATLLASSWDTALVRRVGEAFGEEVREYGVDILLAPGMNIHRNPLGGRNFEYYSEDPLLSGAMAAAFIEGVESRGVGTSAKHFAANNQEFNRMQLNTIVGERALREIYLKGFEIAVERAQPWTVMTAYNLINGTYASQSRDLLTRILREEWGFEGFVVTDWFGGDDPVAQIDAGNDVIMPGSPSHTQTIVTAVAKGELSEARLDESVARVLRIIEKSPTFRQVPYGDRPDLEAHGRLARRAAAESMVLLKNRGGALPLAAGARIALFGNASYDLILGGTGSGDVNEAYSVQLDDGLAAAGFAVDDALVQRYHRYLAAEKAARPRPAMPFMPVPPIAEMPVHADAVRRAARDADVALITIGRNSGEFRDRQEAEFGLDETERALIREVAAAFGAGGKDVVVVMNVAGVTDVASWSDGADAVLVAWQPGQEGGNAIADVLGGSVNPSGRLPATIPVAYADVASAGSFPGRLLAGQPDAGGPALFGRPSEVTYDEGIYVGYRYHDTFGVEPAYPFGFGLSYTEFEYGSLRLDGMTASVTLTNAGDVAGREVVQLYVSAPGGGLDKPARELRAFGKTDLLEPGQSQTLTFVLTPADLASYDEGRSAWVAAPGTYTVSLGPSGAQPTAPATFELPAEHVVERVHRVLVPAAPLAERRPGSQ